MNYDRCYEFRCRYFFNSSFFLHREIEERLFFHVKLNEISKLGRISFCEMEIRTREETHPPRPCRLRSTILHPARRSNRSGLLPQTGRTFARVNCKPLSQSDRPPFISVSKLNLTLSSFSFSNFTAKCPTFSTFSPYGDFPLRFF